MRLSGRITKLSLAFICLTLASLLAFYGTNYYKQKPVVQYYLSDKLSLLHENSTGLSEILKTDKSDYTSEELRKALKYQDRLISAYQDLFLLFSRRKRELCQSAAG